MKGSLSSTRSARLAPAGLVVVVVAIFFQVTSFEFITYDDPISVYENASVRDGLSAKDLREVFTEVGPLNLWHPITDLSHRLDAQLFGVDGAAGKHHAVSLFWHVIAVLGLYFLLLRLTGSAWIAVSCALLWAVHPHRVQSVAWVTERKDVLAGAFMLWSVYFWDCWRGGKGGRVSYWVAVVLFMLAAMSKPSVLPLPLILIGAEYFRSRGTNLRIGLVGVLPFLLISLCVGGLTIYLKQQGGMQGLEALMPLEKRLVLMPVGLSWYFAQFFLPTELQLWVYPPELGWQSLGVAVAWLSLAGGMAWWARSRKIVVMGFIAFFFLWLPVSGIVPVSIYYVAARYSYFIHLGLVVVVAGYLRWLLARVNIDIRRITGLSVAIWICLLGIATARHLPDWKDSRTLYTREMQRSARSLLAPLLLADIESNEGNTEQALQLYLEAREIDGGSGLAATGAGQMYTELGQLQRAESHFRAAMRSPILHQPTPFLELSFLLIEQQRVAEAEGVLSEARERFPSNSDVFRNSAVLAEMDVRNRAAAVKFYQKAVALDPSNLDALQGLGVLHLRLGNREEGLRCLTEVLRRDPRRRQVRAFLQSQRQSN